MPVGNALERYRAGSSGTAAGTIALLSPGIWRCRAKCAERAARFESPWRYSEGLVICGAFVVSGAFVRRILRSQRARRSVQRSHAAPASRGGWRPGPTFASPGTAGRGDGHRRTPTPNVRGRLPDPGVNTAVPDGRNGADDKDF